MFAVASSLALRLAATTSLALRLATTSGLALRLVEDQLSEIRSAHLLSALCGRGGRRGGRSIGGLVGRRSIGGLVGGLVSGLVGGLGRIRGGCHLAAATLPRCGKRAGYKLNKFLS